jgi:pyruvate,water dikinase
MLRVSRNGKTSRERDADAYQAPSDYPEFAEFLVREGIDSIALNPDTVLKTMIAVKELEDRLN